MPDTSNASASYAVGIDIGGTFTDIVFYDRHTGRHLNGKVLTTHDDPADAVIDGMTDMMRQHGIASRTVHRVVHATTLFTNALIERKGARTGLITTEGFGDTLRVGRERKYDIYDLFIDMPQALVPGELIGEVPERMRADGSVRQALDLDALNAAVDRLVERGIESLAVCYLHAYANPAHEQLSAKAIAARHPGLKLTTSHSVSSVIREYERMSTAAANAYIMPLAHRYLDGLAARIAALDIAAPLFLMLSNGGLTHVDEAKRVPIQLLESGPAAGALAGAFFGRSVREAGVLAFDMGGTTAKLSVVDQGEPLIAHRFEAARERRFMEGSGLPINISAIELIEIGAGGGSIARIDAMELLKVGPHSAGSMPGPAAYRRGGTLPTVTDADFVLGYLDPAYFAGGTVPIDVGLAKGALAPLAERADIAVARLAWGIHDVVNENMASAARVHIAERGKDPRNYAILPTGGAGPVHAYYVAKKLGLKRVICPPAAGVASALGLLMAPARIDRAVTRMLRIDDADWNQVEREFEALAADALAVIEEVGIPRDRATVQRYADLRYVGQGFEIVAKLPDGPYDASAAQNIVAAFAQEYLKVFAHLPPSGAVEIVNLRVSAVAPIADQDVVLHGFGAGSAKPRGQREVYFPELNGFARTDVYSRYELPIGMQFDGPAVIEERESTLVVGPGAKVAVHDSGSLIVTLPE